MLHNIDILTNKADSIRYNYLDAKRARWLYCTPLLVTDVKSNLHAVEHWKIKFELKGVAQKVTSSSLDIFFVKSVHS